METKYFPETDQLCITLSSTPASGGGSQISDGVWFFYDEEDKIVSIEFEFAGDKIDLTDIKETPTIVMKESTKPILTRTVTELAREWGVVPRTIQRVITKMTQAGITVGKQLGPTYPIILYDADVKAIEKWRKKHPAGRPGGWDKEKTQRVLIHYETQTEDEAVIEDDLMWEDTKQTVMEIPVKLVPAVRELLAKHEET